MFKDMSKENFEQWWREFKVTYARSERTDVEARAVFKLMCQRRYMDFVYEVKRAYMEKEKRMENFTDEVWARFVSHLQAPDAIAASKRAKKHRAGTSGSGVKHTIRSINVAEHQARMVAVDAEVVEGRIEISEETSVLWCGDL